jgi:hypothetical protein
VYLSLAFLFFTFCLIFNIRGSSSSVSRVLNLQENNNNNSSKHRRRRKKVFSSRIRRHENNIMQQPQIFHHFQTSHLAFLGLVFADPERSLPDSGFANTANYLMRTAMKLPPHILPTLNELSNRPQYQGRKMMIITVSRLLKRNEVFIKLRPVLPDSYIWIAYGHLFVTGALFKICCRYR